MRFIKYLFLLNPVKSITLILTPVFIYFALHINKVDIKQSGKILGQTEISGSKYLIVEGSQKPYLWQFDDKTEKITPSNTIEYKSENPISYLFWALGIVSTLITLIGSFVDDPPWDLTRVKVKTNLNKILCEQDGNHIYYSYKGKLLAKCDHWAEQYYVEMYLGKYFETESNLLPDYESVQSMRDRKLKSLI
jgi:hypothetical protein